MLLEQMCRGGLVFVVEIRTLTLTERSRIWAEMSAQQRQAYEMSMTYRISDRVLNRIFQGSSAWRLIAVNIDYDWDLRKRGRAFSPALFYECGRPLRYQFELVSVSSSNKRILLGSTHFAEVLGISPKVAREVAKHLNQIQSLMDEVLIRYRAGERFPKQFVSGIEDGLLKCTDKSFAQRMQTYMSADMPITGNARERLNRLLKRRSSDLTQGGDPVEVTGVKTPDAQITTLDAEIRSIQRSLETEISEKNREVLKKRVKRLNVRRRKLMGRKKGIELFL